MAIARAFSVHVVSAEARVRTSHVLLLQELGYAVRAFGDACEFRANGIGQYPECLVLDQGLPNDAAPELQRLAQEAERRIPVVCVASDASAARAVRAMKDGAIDFLCTPVSAADLAQAVSTAVDVAFRWRAEDGRRARALALLDRLTPRERAVFELVLDGKLNKQIASCLGSREATVKVHRSRLMRKLEVRSLVELLNFGREIHVVLKGDHVLPPVPRFAANARPIGVAPGRLGVVGTRNAQPAVLGEAA